MSSIFLHRGDLPDGLDLGPAIAVDSETMGLQPGRDRLCLVQLSAGDGTAHRQRAGREALERGGADRKVDQRRRQLRRRGAGVRVLAQVGLQPATKAFALRGGGDPGERRAEQRRDLRLGKVAGAR